MKKLLLAALTTFTVVLTGCLGGGGGGGYTHAQLADDFVYRLNFALGYDVEIVKYNTNQYDYIVVYDYDYGTYDAYYIGDYLPSDDINGYVSYWNADFFYDLTYIGGNDYQDPFTGYIFNREEMFNRNQLKVAGIREADVLTSMSNHLVQSFEIPQASAQKIAKASLMANLMQRQGAGEAKYEDMALQLTGTTADQWRAAEGNPLAIEKLKNTTAKSLQMSSDDLNRFFGKMMSNDGILDLN